jgi:hypothetical protein
MVFGAHEYVLRLEISMHDTEHMHIVDTGQYLLDDISCFVFSEGLDLLKSIVEIATITIFCINIDRGLVMTDCMNTHDMRMDYRLESFQFWNE